LLQKSLQAYSPKYQEHTVEEQTVTQLAPDAVEMTYLHSSSPLNVELKMILPVPSVTVNNYAASSW
jgi:hypothetical protein